jgi:hypothetical protein
MIKSQKSQLISSMSTDEETRTWIEEHLSELRHEYVNGQRLLIQFIGLGFVLGLAAHVAGYVLLSSAPTGLRGLFADLLRALGGSLWTGVVLALFVQVIPEVKRRQIKHAIDEYESARRDNARE